MRKAAVLLTVAAAVVVTAAAPAGAIEAIPSPVYISDTGACSSGYIEVVQAGDSAVCVIRLTPPSVRITTNGCDTDETAYLILDTYGVCTS